MPTIIVVLVAVVVLGLLLLTSTVRIVQEYEQGVIYRLVRFVGAREPADVNGSTPHAPTPS